MALPGEALGGRSMAFQTLRKVLNSPVYVGRLIHGDEDVLSRTRARWEPLVDDATWRRVRERVDGHRTLPRQASQRHLLSGLLRCPRCGSRMHGKARRERNSRYPCSGRHLAANAPVPGCEVSALGWQVEAAVLNEVLPLVEAAVSTLPELREALGRAWAALREPTTVQDTLQERQRARLIREAEQARSRLTTAAVLFADGQIDKLGYELLRDKAQADLRAATEALDGLHPAASRPDLPPLEIVLAAAEGWGAAMRDGEVAAQREVLAALIERVVPVRVGRGKYGAAIAWTPLGEALRAAGAPVVRHLAA